MVESIPSPEPTSLHELSIRSFGRLHFGLMEICDRQPHRFGGIGLMIDHATATLQASVAKLPQSAPQMRCQVISEPYWQSRIQSILDHWSVTHDSLSIDSLSAIGCPRPHRGLGSGTQMACTVAAILLAADNWANSHPRLDASRTKIESFALSLETLAELSQRGKRSNIGLRGFLEGGFILDRGQSLSASEHVIDPSQRTQRVSFPTAWPILILQSESHDGDSGSAESLMFEQCSQQSNPSRIDMMKLAEQEILPSIAFLDWQPFSLALGQYGRLAGKIFEPVQGGIYRTPQIAETIAVANELGLMSATQSSWGPTVCAFAKDDDHAAWCVEKLQPRLERTSIHVTRAVNHGAQFVPT